MVIIRIMICFFPRGLFPAVTLLAQTPVAGASQVPSKPPATSNKPAEQASTPSPNVPASMPIITIHGVCPAPGSSATAASTARKIPASKPCDTVVTREQFEKLVDAIGSSGQVITPTMRRDLARGYVELMAFAQAAEKEGLDKDPKFVEILRVVRMRTLTDFYQRAWTEKLRTPPADEVSAYYEASLSKYEQVTFSRIFIPAKNPAAQNKDDWDKKASATANSIRDRAAQGEDMEKLQKEAYTTLGLTILPPSTAIGAR